MDFSAAPGSTTRGRPSGRGTRWRWLTPRCRNTTASSCGRAACRPGPRIHPRLDERQRIGIRVRQLALRRQERGTVPYPRVEGQRRDRADGGGKRPDLLPAAPGRGPRGESVVPAGLRPGPVLRRTEIPDPATWAMGSMPGISPSSNGRPPPRTKRLWPPGAHGAT